MPSPESPPRDIHTMPRRRKIEFVVFGVLVLSVIGVLVAWMWVTR